MTVSLGLIPHFEIASLALIFPSYLLLTGYLIYKKYILLTDLLWVGTIFFLTFLPHLIYDLSHNFYNLRGILAVLPNSNNVTENADFYTRLIDRVHLVKSDLRAAFPSVPMKFLYLFLGTILIGSYAFMRDRSVAKNKKLFILNLYFTLSLSFIVLLMLPFPKAEIWWIPYFSIIYIFITGIILKYLWDFKSIIFKFLVLIILFIFIKSETERVFQMINENSNLKEQKYNIKVQEPIEYIYKDSKDMPFNILYITEEIYVLSYKYMFWYIGHTKYPNSKGFKNLDLDYILPGGPAVPLNKKGQFNNLEKGLYYVIITQKSIDSGYASKFLKYPVGKLVDTKNFENNYVLQKHVIE